MKILYDHQTFTTQQYGGIPRYFCELTRFFSKCSDLSFEFSLRYSINENLANQPELFQYWSNRSGLLSNHLLLTFQKKLNKNLLYHLKINQKESIRLLEKGDFDIFHPTGYNPYFLDHIRKPFVLTVYDMIHEKYPEYYPGQDATTRWKKKVIEKADSIIAISQNTKQDIVHYFNVEPDHISVVYLGNPLEQALEVSNQKQFHKNPMLNSKYILFVGSRERYKNFRFFVSSITSLLQKHDDLHLFCAGGGQFTQREKNQLLNLKILSKVHYISINDEIMIDLYKNAQAFVFPSLYEGFGLPVLEAFSCGCPLIASQNSSLSEIAGDAARYIDPHDKISIVAGIESLLNDNDYREELICKGYERLKLFSWERTARETKKIYENII